MGQQIKDVNCVLRLDENGELGIAVSYVDENDNYYDMNTNPEQLKNIVNGGSYFSEKVLNTSGAIKPIVFNSTTNEFTDTLDNRSNDSFILGFKYNHQSDFYKEKSLFTETVIMYEKMKSLMGVAKMFSDSNTSAKFNFFVNDKRLENIYLGNNDEEKYNSNVDNLVVIANELGINMQTPSRSKAEFKNENVFKLR